MTQRSLHYAVPVTSHEFKPFHSHARQFIEIDTAMMGPDEKAASAKAVQMVVMPDFATTEYD